jgi:hypothetical protein
MGSRAFLRARPYEKQEMLGRSPLARLEHLPAGEAPPVAAAVAAAGDVADSSEPVAAGPSELDGVVEEPDAVLGEPDAVVVEHDGVAVEPDAVMVLEPDAVAVEPDPSVVEPDPAMALERPVVETEPP